MFREYFNTLVLCSTLEISNPIFLYNESAFGWSREQVFTVSLSIFGRAHASLTAILKSNFPNPVPMTPGTRPKYDKSHEYFNLLSRIKNPAE